MEQLDKSFKVGDHVVFEGTTDIGVVVGATVNQNDHSYMVKFYDEKGKPYLSPCAWYALTKVEIDDSVLEKKDQQKIRNGG